MESIVEDVEDERETEGSPANDQCFEDSGRWDDINFSISVDHSDGLCCRHYEGRHCQTDKKCYVYFEKYSILITSSEE